MSNEAVLQAKTQEQIIFEWLGNWIDDETGGISAEVTCMTSPGIFYFLLKHQDIRIRNKTVEVLEKLCRELISFKRATELGRERDSDNEDIKILAAITDN